VRAYPLRIHPGVGARKAKLPAHRRQRDGHDGGVDHRHKRSEAQQKERQAFTSSHFRSDRRWSLASPSFMVLDRIPLRGQNRSSLTLIHPSVWKENSANFTLKLSEKGF
jgi:hypothetical protein